jgi:hypothetical protein|tara:strand:- start:905 stop:1354 length:450 start_codon:yes stop_codon:yes gene_type:complete
MLPATPLDRTVRAGLKQIFRTYGIIGTVRQVSASVNNAVTGRSARTISDFTVKCVVTPVSGKTRFAYDLAYIAAAKNFTLGGQFRHEESIVLMDMKTMKNASGVLEQIEMHDEHKFMLDGIEYSIKRDTQQLDAFQVITIVEGTDRNVS